MQALRAGQVERARARLKAMAAALPRSFNVPYLEAVVAHQAGDFARARELTQRLLRAGADSPPLLMLAGSTERRLGALEQAEHLFGKALAARPDHPALRRELAEIELERGRPAAALVRLKAVLDADPRDAMAWSVAAQAHTLLGDFGAADAAFARARAARPGDTATRLAFARSQLARGDGSAGIAELRALADAGAGAASAAGPGTRQALLDLVPALARRGDLQGALAAVDRLAREQPKAAEPELLRGSLLEQQGDAAAARKAYETALQRQPGYALAVDRLARLDLAQGQPAEAKARYEAQLKRDPKSAAAMLAMAEIERITGAEPAAVQRWLDQAVQARPDDDRVWLAAIELERGIGGATLLRAQRAAAALPDQPEILAALADAQRLAGEARQAAATLRKAVALRPEAAALKLQLADALVASGQLAAARQAVDQALAKDPQGVDTLRAHVLLLWREGRGAAAVTLAEQERKRVPTDPARALLAADLHALDGQAQLLMTALREGVARTRNTRVANRYVEELRQRGNAREAAAFENEWLARAPRDADFMAYAAQQAQRSGDRTAAVALYRRALTVVPQAPILQNNLASLLLLAGEPKLTQEALALAQSAAAGAPGNAAVLDTLALAQAATGKPKDGLVTQELALRLEPDSPTLRLTQARLLIQAGDKGKAREQLERLARRDIGVPFQNEVKALLAQLS
jgi:cellulose synthase operon protein C